jgi:hypothetical protein
MARVLIRVRNRPPRERYRTGLTREHMSLWFAGYPKTPGCDVRFGSFATGPSKQQDRPCPLCRRKRKSIQPLAAPPFVGGRDSGSETGASTHAPLAEISASSSLRIRTGTKPQRAAMLVYRLREYCPPISIQHGSLNAIELRSQVKRFSNGRRAQPSTPIGGQTARRCTTIGIAIRLPLFLIGMGQEKYRTCR